MQSVFIPIRVRREELFIHCAEKGNPNGTPLFFLHGFAANGKSFEESIFPFLPDSIRAIAVDFPGFGLSSHSNHYSLHFYQKVVCRVMDGLRITAAHFYGMSMGGSVGIMLAAETPHRVRTLSVQGPPLQGSRAIMARFLMLVPWFIVLIKISPLLAAAQFERLYRKEDIIRLRQAFPTLRELVAVGLRRASPRALLHLGWEMAHPAFNLAPALEMIEAPAFLIDGDSVEPLWPNTLPLLRQHVRHAEHLLIHAGHLATFVEPQPVAACLTDFIFRHNAAWRMPIP